VPGCCHSPNSGEWRGGASQGMSARTRLGPWEGATVVEWPRDRVQGSLGNGGNNCGRQHDKHGRGRVSTAFIERGGGRRGSFTSPRRHSARGGLARPMRWEAGLRSDRGGGHSARGAWLRGMPGGCDGGGRTRTGRDEVSPWALWVEGPNAKGRLADAWLRARTRPRHRAETRTPERRMGQNRPLNTRLTTVFSKKLIWTIFPPNMKVVV
jgi:hypothetical protein